MSARRDERKAIFDAAKDSFKDHVLTVELRSDHLVSPHETKPISWRCGRPDTMTYSFRVAELPGCIVQWGDVGGLVIDQGRGYDIEWLKGAAKDSRYVDYLLSKVKTDKSRFVPDLFHDYLAEHGDAKAMNSVFSRRKDRGEWTYEDFYEYAQYSGDIEVGSCCFDYPIDVLWGVAALVKFVELLRQEPHDRAG